MDESGDMQFGAKATQHFALTAVCTTTPTRSASALQQLKYDLMSHGSQDLEFHATENSKGTRLRVIDTLNTIAPLRIHTIWIDKGFTHPSMQNSVALLGLFAKAMGRWTARVFEDTGVDQVVMIFDSVLTVKERDAFLKQLKPLLKTLPIKFRILFHPVKQDLNGQIADYFSWSWHRQIEAGDSAWVERLQPDHHWDKFNLFQAGKYRYWTRPEK